MALFDSMQQNSEQPQRNQYLQDNPATQDNANTSWMSPSDSSGGNTKSVAQSQPNPPSQVSNGTMLGSIAQGSGSGMFGTTAPSRDQLSQYSQGRGSQFGDSSLNYWSNPQKWQELVQRGQQLQPGSDGSWYANKFLSNAEEFTGGAHQTAMNMWGSDPAQQNNSQQGGLMALLQQLLGGGGQQGPQGPRQQDLQYNQYAGKGGSIGGGSPMQGSLIGATPAGNNAMQGSLPGNPGSMIGQNTGVTGGMISGDPQPLGRQQMGLLDPTLMGGTFQPGVRY